MIALDAMSFLFVLFHAITWFNLAPRAIDARLGGSAFRRFWSQARIMWRGS